MIPQRPGRQSQVGRYSSRISKKLAEGDTKVALSKAQQKKQAKVGEPVIINPEVNIQNQTQYS